MSSTKACTRSRKPDRYARVAREVGSPNQSCSEFRLPCLGGCPMSWRVRRSLIGLAPHAAMPRDAAAPDRWGRCSRTSLFRQRSVARRTRANAGSPCRTLDADAAPAMRLLGLGTLAAKRPGDHRRTAQARGSCPGARGAAERASWRRARRRAGHLREPTAGRAPDRRRGERRRRAPGRARPGN